jgi:hypothetical protein
MATAAQPDELIEQIREDEYADLLQRVRELANIIENANHGDD